MQTSILSRQHEHDHTHDAECASCGIDHEHTPVRLTQTVIGLIFIINSYIVDLIFKQPVSLVDPSKDQGTMVGMFSAMIGALVLGYPIVWTSFKDIRRGILSINELVGI